MITQLAKSLGFLIDHLGLTIPQTDEVIKIFSRLVDHIPTLLGLIGTGIVIIRQVINKHDSDKKIATVIENVADNTSLTHEVKAVAIESVKKADAAYNEANNVNTKLASLGIQTKPELGASSANPVHTITP